MENVAGAVKELMQAGKVKHFGMSEAGERSIRASHVVQPVAALQSEYSLFWRDPEKEILPTQEEFGIELRVLQSFGQAIPHGQDRRRHAIVLIPGTTKLHRLEENLGGASVVFSADDLREMDAALSPSRTCRIPAGAGRGHREIREL